MILLLSLRAFCFSFPACSTYIFFQSASFLATRWGRMYYVASLKAKLSPRWKRVLPSHPAPSWIWPGFWKGLSYFSVASYTGELFLKVHSGVFMEYCEIRAAFMKDYKLYSSLQKLKIQLEMFCSQQTCNLHKIGKEMFWINNALVYFSPVWEPFFFQSTSCHRAPPPRC